MTSSDRDLHLLSHAAANLAGVIADTNTPPYRHDGVYLHALAAANHLARVPGGDQQQPVLPLTGNPVEASLRSSMRCLALLSAQTFDSDGILDAIRELQSALAATG